MAKRNFWEAQAVAALSAAGAGAVAFALLGAPAPAPPEWRAVTARADLAAEAPFSRK